MKCLSFLALLALSSCSTPEIRNLEETPYRTSGVEQFFLPELPAWANFSVQGQCTKGSSLHYLNFPKLAATYQLTYPQMAELQAQYNGRLEDYFRSSSERFLKPMEESAFFSNTLEQVRGGIRQFKLPNDIKEVDLVWVEDIVKSGKTEEFKRAFASGKFDERPVVLFSSCLTRQGLSQWIVQNDLEDQGLYLLTSEWLSTFGSDLTARPALAVEVRKLLAPDVKVFFVKPHTLPPTSEIIL